MTQCMYIDLKFQIREINHDAGSHGVSGMENLCFYYYSWKPNLWPNPDALALPLSDSSTI